MRDFLPLAQIIVSIGLIVLVLFQQKGAALGSAFGQEGGFYATRRGLQNKIFWGTIVLGALFIILAVLNLIL